MNPGTLNTGSPNAGTVKPVVDALWRALAYCLHPRVILLSLLPLVITASLAVALGYFFWENSIATVRASIEGWALIQMVLGWVEGLGITSFREMLPPLVVVVLALPALVILSLLLVSLMMTPALVKMVARRRFPYLERRRGASFWHSLWFSLVSTLAALVALVLSVPLWLVPPLVLVLPPLIWGWLTYRVMSFDSLAEHASAAERRLIMKRRWWPLLGIGIVCGYLGAAPALIWAVSATVLVLAPFLVLASVWLYTLVFAFSALWFAHYTLAELHRLRAAGSPAPSIPLSTPLLREPT